MQINFTVKIKIKTFNPENGGACCPRQHSIRLLSLIESADETKVKSRFKKTKASACFSLYVCFWVLAGAGGSFIAFMLIENSRKINRILKVSSS